jgi:hypothetical protein
MAAREPHGDSDPQSNPLEAALVHALHSQEPASAWNMLRDLVCQRVRMMRRAGESKMTVIDTLSGIAREALRSEVRNRELKRVAEDLIVEVSLWCIDEYDEHERAEGAAARQPS